VSAVLCNLYQGLSWLLSLYTIILLVYAVLSWIPDLRGRWTYYLAAVVEPVLMPIRRVVPVAGGIDWSFLVLIVLINFVLRPLLNNLTANACYLY
jgi:YggT family protein